MYLFFTFLLKNFYLFGSVGSLLLHEGSLSVTVSGGYSSCGEQASYCGGFSQLQPQALGCWASAVAAHRLSSCGPQALEHGTGNCGPWAWLPPGVWDLPGSGIRLCLLHWQVDSQPLNHQGSLTCVYS